MSVSISVKLAVFLAIQTAATLGAIATYYAYLQDEIRSYAGVFSVLTRDAKSLHRRLDRPPAFNERDRAALRTFAVNVDSANVVLTRGGNFQGFRCKPVPPELADLFEQSTARWKRARPALFSTADAPDVAQAEARRKLHTYFTPWQATLATMERSLTRREGTLRVQMANTFALVGAVNVISVALVLWLARRSLIKPVQAVEAAAVRVGSGDYSMAAPVRGNDEISSLAKEFNRMSAKLRETVSALRLSEQNLAHEARALEKSNRELEQYAYAAAHDLQEPLRTLSLYVQLLERRVQLPPDVAPLTAQIQASAARMRRLVRDLLLHSRSVHEPSMSVVTIANDALAEVLTDFGDEIAKAGAVIDAAPLPVVLASGPDLELVFRNLISNALKYHRNVPIHISIRASTTEDLCTISVSDNGMGIHPDYHERVFGLFKRLHGAEVPGTGVGLAIAKNVIEKHGGRIWVDSRAGAGATFHFELRLAAPPVAAAAV